MHSTGVQALLEQPLAGGRDAPQEGPSQHVVAEAEPEPVDAQDPRLTESFELLDELGGVRAEQFR